MNKAIAVTYAKMIEESSILLFMKEYHRKISNLLEVWYAGMNKNRT